VTTPWFPADFVWGTAAASYQIEGASNADGKADSVWDMFCRRPGAIWQGHTGDTACDHYHRYSEDVALMQQFGIKAYRLSLSWPRILPDGIGRVNAAGLAFYDRLIDTLLAANIQPYVTLFHWDYPLALYHRGGWLNPESPDWFAEYTRVVVERFSDRVTHWMTLNEPQCYLVLGHQEGVHAPGLKLGFADVLQATHHSLLAHGKSIQAIRAYSKRPAQVGYAPAATCALPASDDPKDIDAARIATFSTPGKHLWSSAWFSDPMFLKQYPEDGVALFGRDMPKIGANDFDIIGQPLDFYGANMYHSPFVRMGQEGKPELVPNPVGQAVTLSHWSVVPECMYWGPRFFWERYKKPIYITENGVSCMDWVALDGRVHDPQRIDFVGRHLLAFARAGAEGADIRGYFHWSFMDNFEWAEGYKQRFGLVYVDFTTQQRIPKDSVYWYRDLIQSNGELLVRADMR